MRSSDMMKALRFVSWLDSMRDVMRCRVTCARIFFGSQASRLVADAYILADVIWKSQRGNASVHLLYSAVSSPTAHNLESIPHEKMHHVSEHQLHYPL